MTGSGKAGKAAWWLWWAAIVAGTAAIGLGIPAQIQDRDDMAAAAWAFGGLAFFLWLVSGILYRHETTAQQKALMALMQRACGELGVDTGDATVTPLPRRHAG